MTGSNQTNGASPHASHYDDEQLWMVAGSLPEGAYPSPPSLPAPPGNLEVPSSGKYIRSSTTGHP